MTDEELVKRLRSYAKDQGGWHNIDDTCEEAADRIEALTAKVKLMDDLDVINGEKIEALTEQLEAARADAKEAEAYAEELEKERDHWQGVAGREGVCMTCHGPRGAPEPYGCSDCLNTGYCGEWHNQMQELREKLAKAVAALGRAKASIENGGGGGVTDVVWLDDPCPETLCDFIDATLAEIEGEKG